MKSKILTVFLILLSALWKLILAWATDFTSIPLIMMWVLTESYLLYLISKYYEKTPISEQTWIYIVLIFDKISTLDPIIYTMYYQQRDVHNFVRKVDILFNLKLKK